MKVWDILEVIQLVFRERTNDIDLLFSSDYVIGELDPEFESIPYDGD